MKIHDVFKYYNNNIINMKENNLIYYSYSRSITKINL